MDRLSGENLVRRIRPLFTGQQEQPQGQGEVDGGAQTPSVRELKWIEVGSRFSDGLNEYQMGTSQRFPSEAPLSILYELSTPTNSLPWLLVVPSVPSLHIMDGSEDSVWLLQLIDEPPWAPLPPVPREILVDGGFYELALCWPKEIQTAIGKDCSGSDWRLLFYRGPFDYRMLAIQHPPGNENRFYVGQLHRGKRSMFGLDTTTS